MWDSLTDRSVKIKPDPAATSRAGVLGEGDPIYPPFYIRYFEGHTPGWYWIFLRLADAHEYHQVRSQRTGALYNYQGVWFGPYRTSGEAFENVCDL
jgi:hypothetical protein